MHLLILEVVVKLSNYGSEQKRIIAIESDLLENPLTLQERMKYSETIFDERINAKVADLLSQGVKLGRELEKLAQRGINIIFKDHYENNDIFDIFEGKPRMLFVVGNHTLLNKNVPGMAYSYEDFKSASAPVVLVADRPINILLGYSDIIDRLESGNVVLISDSYRGKSNLQATIYDNKKGENSINKKVFIYGSRTQEEIPKSVQESLEAIRNQKIKILIGDSEKGVDNEIIDYLRFSPKYPYVDIFTVKQKPRVKVEPEWTTRLINTDKSLKPQQKQMVKDREMANEADWGLGIFNPISKNRYDAIQVSSGTLRNSIQMLLNDKAVKFFFVINGNVEYRNLANIEQLKKLIELYKDEKISESEKIDILTSKGVKESELPNLVKYAKISKKFDELLKIELKELESKQITRQEKEDKKAEQLTFDLFNN